MPELFPPIKKRRKTRKSIKSIPVQIRFPEDTVARMDALAEANGIDRSSLIRLAVADKLRTGLSFPKSPRASALSKETT